MKYKLLIFPILFLSFFIFSKVNAENIIKDSDYDGLSDTIEVGKYKSDPFKADSDNDGYSDFVETKYNTDPRDDRSKPLVDKNNINVDSSKYYWLFSRASGVTAFILLSIGICFGMGISSRSAYKVFKPPIALETHNTISIIALVAVILHAGALLFDSYFYLKIQEALVPFLLERNFKSELGYDFKFAIGLGIIAFYLITVLVITSVYRAKMSLRLWRKIHYTSFVTYILFVIHGIVSGTDSKALWMQLIYLASISGFILMFLIRIRGVISRRMTKPTPPAPVISNTVTTPVQTSENKSQVSSFLKGQ